LILIRKIVDVGGAAAEYDAEFMKTITVHHSDGFTLRWMEAGIPCVSEVKYDTKFIKR
jgi:hypothetical protein